MARDLTRIGEKARQEPETCFTSIYHFVTDPELLRSCYQKTEGKKAPGIDGVTKQAYGKDLEGNLEDLTERLARMGYRPKPVRRRHLRQRICQAFRTFRTCPPKKQLRTCPSLRPTPRGR